MLPPKINYPWTPDQGDGTYRNPIICADYSDPDVIRDGDDYWLVASSFTCTPGLPILHSRDLVNWTIVNHAIDNLPDPRHVFDTVRPGEGVWAPAIRKHAGKFYIFFPMPDEGIYVTTASDPRGKWSTPHQLIAGKGLIDPCPLWDDDGKAYLVHAYARSRSGIKNVLRVRPMAPDASHLLGEGKIVYTDPVHQPTLEGPKFHKFNGMYYISAPAGGVPTGWQLILRSKNVYGPYEPKIVLEQGPTSPINGPHQGAIIDTPPSTSSGQAPSTGSGQALSTGSGQAHGKQWWFIHFQDAGVYGRIINLEPVHWQDGWPLMGIDRDGNGIGEPVLHYAKPNVPGPIQIAVPQTSDEFDSDTLGLQWQWQANHHDGWASLSARKGWMRLYAASVEKDLGKLPNQLLQKLPARRFVCETSLEILPDARDVQAGLIVTGKKHAALVVERQTGGPRLLLVVDNKTVASEALNGAHARLRVAMDDGGECHFGFADDTGDFSEIGQPFQAVEGVWIGAKVGLFCRSTGAKPTRSYADFDYFRFSAAR